MLMNSGELNKRITIFKKESGEDEDGFPVNNEVTVRECWAKVNKISGTQLVKSNAELTQNKLRFVIRYSSIPIDEKMFIRYNDKIYDIKYINDYNESHDFVEIWGECNEL